MPLLVFIYVAFQLLTVAYIDVKSKKISNSWAIANIFLYAALVFLLPTYYKFSFDTFVWPIGFFVAGFLLFIVKVMGGGDSKYLASFYLLIPVQFHEEAFMSLAVATLFVGGSVFIKNIMKNSDLIVLAWKEKNAVHIRNVFGKKFSFAPVIFISWMWFGWTIKDSLIFF
jgi:prepilin peptidase CpaA